MWDTSGPLRDPVIRVGQLRKWNRNRGLGGDYTYFLVIGERMVQGCDGFEKWFMVRYPDGTQQEYWESDLMPGFNETYDEHAEYSEEVGNEPG